MNEEMQSNAENQASSGLGAILSNPEMLSKMAEAVKKLGIVSDDTDEKDAEIEKSEETDAGKDRKESAAAFGGFGDLASPLSAIASNPEIMSKLPALLSAFGSMGGKGKGDREKDGKGKDDKRIKLLLALRPYLSEHRRQVIDYLIKMNTLGDVLKNIK